MASKAYLSDYTNSFLEGMITRVSPEQLSPSACSVARNVILDRYSAQKRFGFSKVNASELAAAAAVRSLYICNGQGSITNKIMAMSAGKIYSMTTGGVATERATGLNTSQQWDFAEGTLVGTQRVIMVASGNAPYQWDGAAATASTFVGPATHGDYVAYHYNKLWIADADLRTIYASARDDFNTWDPLDFLIVGKDSDGPITRLVPMGRYLVIFMQKAVYLLYGNRIRYPRNVSIEQVELQDGCPAPWTVTNIKGQIFFVGNEGFYVLIGKQAKKISFSIEDEYSSISRTNIVTAAAGRVGNLWVVSVPHGSAQVANNRTYCIHWNLPPNSFGDYPITYFDGLVSGAWTYSTGLRKMYLSSQTSGYVYLYDSTLYSDDGAAIPFELVTRGLTFGDQYAEKSLLKIQPQFDVVTSGSVVISAGANETATASFVEAPAATTALPLGLGATGSFMGEYGGDLSYARNGIAHYPMAPVAGGDPLVGTWFRARFYDSSTRSLTLRRCYYEAASKAR